MANQMNEQDFSLLFAADDGQMKQFVETNRDRLDDYVDDLLRDDSYTQADKRQALFAAIYGVVVDWREFDDEIVNLLGRAIPDENVAVVTTDEGLLVTYNDVQYPIVLTFSPADRYVTIRGFQAIIKDKYEIRLFERSYYSDTHELCVLPNEVWQLLEQQYGDQVGEVFRVIDEGLDFP